MNKIAKKYIKECKQTFPFITKKEKAFFKRLEENLDEHEGTYHEICSQLGTPKEVMISYFDNCEDEYVIKKAATKSTVKRGMLVIMAMVLAVCLLTIYYNQMIYREYKNSRIIVEETIIEEE